MEAIPNTLFSTDGYFLHPINILLILLGLFIWHKLKPRWVRWAWVGLLVLAAVGCELMWAQHNDIGNRLTVNLLCIPVIDFSVGPAVLGITRALRRFITWITTNEEETTTEGGTP